MLVSLGIARSIEEHGTFLLALLTLCRLDLIRKGLGDTMGSLKRQIRDLFASMVEFGYSLDDCEE